MKIKDRKLSCAICQPHFLPWIGYFEMIDRVDVFVYLDDVQFPRQGWVNRNRIRSDKRQGWDWLTVPVHHEAKLSKKISETKISTHPWKRTIQEKIERAYCSSMFFSEAEELIDLLDSKYKTIADLNIELLDWGLKKLQIKTDTVRSSVLNVDGIKEEKLIGIIEKIDCKFYLANNGSKPYIQSRLFHDNGIDITFQNYNHPSYNGYSADKLPFLSFIDLLFMVEPEKRLTVIRDGRSKLCDTINAR